jgi:hypothetical protein
MALALIVIVLGTLFGAASYASAPVLIAAGVAITAWLAVFALRERAHRTPNR